MFLASVLVWISHRWSRRNELGLHSALLGILPRMWPSLACQGASLRDAAATQPLLVQMRRFVYVASVVATASMFALLLAPPCSVWP